MGKNKSEVTKSSFVDLVKKEGDAARAAAIANLAAAAPVDALEPPKAPELVDPVLVAKDAAWLAASAAIGLAGLKSDIEVSMDLDDEMQKALARIEEIKAGQAARLQKNLESIKETIEEELNAGIMNPESFRVAFKLGVRSLTLQTDVFDGEVEFTVVLPFRPGVKASTRSAARSTGDTNAVANAPTTLERYTLERWVGGAGWKEIAEENGSNKGSAHDAARRCAIKLGMDWPIPPSERGAGRTIPV